MNAKTLIKVVLLGLVLSVFFAGTADAERNNR